jgi:hypothetical protein
MDNMDNMCCRHTCTIPASELIPFHPDLQIMGMLPHVSRERVQQLQVDADAAVETPTPRVTAKAEAAAAAVAAAAAAAAREQQQRSVGRESSADSQSVPESGAAGEKAGRKQQQKVKDNFKRSSSNKKANSGDRVQSATAKIGTAGASKSSGSARDSGTAQGRQSSGFVGAQKAALMAAQDTHGAVLSAVLGQRDAPQGSRYRTDSATQQQADQLFGMPQGKALPRFLEPADMKQQADGPSARQLMDAPHQLSTDGWAQAQSFAGRQYLNPATQELLLR